MIGQQIPTADETFPFINRTFTQSQTPRKAYSSVVWLAETKRGEGRGTTGPRPRELYGKWQIADGGTYNINAVNKKPKCSTPGPELP